MKSICKHAYRVAIVCVLLIICETSSTDATNEAWNKMCEGFGDANVAHHTLTLGAGAASEEKGGTHVNDLKFAPKEARMVSSERGRKPPHRIHSFGYRAFSRRGLNYTAGRLCTISSGFH